MSLRSVVNSEKYFPLDGGNDPQDIDDSASKQSSLGMSKKINTIEQLVQVYEKTVPEDMRLDWRILINPRRCAMPLSKFTVGILYGSASAVIYPFYTIFLFSNANVTNIVLNLATLAFSLKVFYGFLSDCVPIYGMRRKPYLAFGWILAFFVTIGALIYCLLGAENDYCFDTVSATNNGRTERIYFRCDTSLPFCNGLPTKTVKEPDGFIFGVFLLLQNIAYIFADVGIDSCSIDWAQREHPLRRGQIQSNNYAARGVGFLLAYVMIGCGLNSAPYSGDFPSDMGIHGVLAIQAALIFIQFPFIYYFIDDKLPGTVYSGSFSEKFRLLYRLASEKAFACLMLFNFFYGIFTYVETKGIRLVAREWVDFTTFLKSVEEIVTWVLLIALFGFGGRYFTNMNWRLLEAFSQITEVLVGLLLLPVVFADLRHPAYYIFINVDKDLFANLSYMVNMWAVNELAIKGLEGTAFAMCTSSNNVSLSLVAYINNLLGNPWPSLQTLKGDSVRMDYLKNWIVVMVFNLFGLVFLPLLPTQKAHAHRRRDTWGTNKILGVSILVFTALLNLFSIATTFGSMTCPDHVAFGGTESTC